MSLFTCLGEETKRIQIVLDKDYKLLLAISPEVKISMTGVIDDFCFGQNLHIVQKERIEKPRAAYQNDHSG